MIHALSSIISAAMLGRRNRFLLSCALVLAPCLAAASINERMSRMFRSMSNTTAPQVHMGGQRGVVTLGHLTIRTSDLQPNLMSVDMPLLPDAPWWEKLPDMNQACGGRNLYLGALSFISKEELVAFLRAIPAHAAAYAFELAISTISPKIHNIMTRLQRIAQAINENMMSSCEIARALITNPGEIRTRYRAMFEGVRRGLFSDEAEPQGNPSPPERRLAQAAPQLAPDVISGNVVWRVIRGHNPSRWYVEPLGRDMDYALMSLIGTRVYCVPGQNGCPLRPSREAHHGGGIDSYAMAHTLTLRDLVYGGTVDLLKCVDNDRDCLHVRADRQMTFRGMRERLLQMLIGPDERSGIWRKIVMGEPPTAQERGFLYATGPLGQGMVRLAVRNPAVAVDYVRDSADLIAVELAYRLADEMLTILTRALAQRPPGTEDGEQEVMALIQDARSRLRDERDAHYRQWQGRTELLAYLHSLEQRLPARVTPGVPVAIPR